ncbi:LytTR family DNA-binding domain-containing protein [uncultured Dysosmobacter sp.]|uniref:LytTR family DNA-binding domain-containing protein n=1 Tax=uncultured Dysosmobacter sp. TaxID=2591384 RepID=UPI002608EAD0|nr:LytTR family DNA-binding domain-containing protein [uncultured Dysosmobacter sp.]
MEVELKIEPSLARTRVVVHAPARTAEVEELLALLTAESGVLLGFREGTAVPLPPESILRFYGEEKEVRVQTLDGTYTVRQRLYELEALLDRRFVRISHSEIVNLRQVTALDLSLTGTIRMTLTGGTVTYASRRYVKKIKEALGL